MLRWLIWSIRCAFCKHEWKYEEGNVETHYTDHDFVSRKTIIHAYCPKCDWHRRHKKF